MNAAACPRRLLWAPQAWVQGGWATDVRLVIDARGHWAEVAAGQPCPPDAERLAGPALPGLVDAHSHAFQRAFAGLAEQRDGAEDDFWRWRDRMYRVANAVTADDLQAIATHLYIELLQGGYTQVCEFHYLQHDVDGARGDDPLALSMALAGAAETAGIGLTLMPALYERAGFQAAELRPDQRRFHMDADQVWRHACDFRRRTAGRPLLNAGLAIHSVRAARPESIARLRALADGFDGPIHAHVSEQVAEVADCLAATGHTPIHWLAAQGGLDARWQLVHATHASADEIIAVGAAGAGVVLCPSTEANLGDGLTDIPAWLDAAVDLAIGSDSQVGRDWREEMRWAEYGQRLRLQRRNVCARPLDPRHPARAPAALLFASALRGGGRAAGQPLWGLEAGARADLLVADADDPALAGLPPARLLDALVFSAPVRPWRDVMAAGRWQVRGHIHAGAGDALADFRRAMHALWQAGD